MVSVPNHSLLSNKSIIVKENYFVNGADTTMDFLTIMLKKNGYDSENNDWFWAKINADGSIAAAGKPGGCIGCHGGASSTDYVWSRIP